MTSPFPPCVGIPAPAIPGWRWRVPRSRARMFAAAVFLTGWLALGQPSDRASDAPRPTESQVKAIYLYNFAKFVAWPSSKSPSGAPLTICLDHADGFIATLQSAVAGETIDGRAVAIKRTSSPGEVGGCNILYIDGSQEDRSQALLAAAAGHSVLTVSDIRDFAKNGGMIEFVLEGGRVRFRVDLGPAQKAGLSLSSQLLKVAQSVSGAPQMGGTR